MTEYSEEKMGKSSPAPPEPIKVDPWETAEAQFEFGKKTALYNKELGQSTFQQTPYGTLEYENVPYGGDGGFAYGRPPPGRIQDGPAQSRQPVQLTPDQELMMRLDIDERGLKNLRAEPLSEQYLQSQIPLEGAGRLASAGGRYSGPQQGDLTPSPAGGDESYGGYGGATTPGGIPITRMVQKLHPAEQALLDQQRGLKGQYGDLAGQLMGKASGMFGTPIDMASLGDMPVADEATRQSVIDSIIERYKPQQDRDRAALETRLVNQGFAGGAEGWQSSMDEINRRENDFRLAANVQGGNEMRANLAQQLGMRQQSLQELLVPRNQTLQELSTFMSGSQPTMPQFGPISSPQVAAPDYAGLAMSSAQMQNQANMNAYNAQMSDDSGLGSLIGTGVGAFLGGPMGASMGSKMGGWFMG